jgi:Tfp pilus assembly protein PilX
MRICATTIYLREDVLEVKSIIQSQLRDDRGITLIVVLIIMVVLVSMIGAGLLFSSINTKIAANYQTGTKAFYAADTGVAAGKNQLALDPGTAMAAFSKNLGGGLAYRSGHRTDAAPQPLQFMRTRSAPAFALNSGSSYNAAGYAFYDYQMNVTGTFTTAYGTELAGREIEAIATFGPVPR